jgi:hypothetical protein
MTPEEHAALPWEDVTSSNLARVALVTRDIGDERPSLLYVEFHHGGTYCYADQAGGETFAEILTAESPGSFLNSEIKPVYECERVRITA